MKRTESLYKRHRFPPGIIQHAVWLYHRFNLSARDIEPYARWRDWTPFTYPFNLSQQPAASVPCGFTAAGAPVGMQIVAAKFADALVLRAARAFESNSPFVMPEKPRSPG
jgi:Asp-tRNA(Asn)/Glu-tRNA(Gln) amidotransferase A subunit family amidase